MGVGWVANDSHALRSSERATHNACHLQRVPPTTRVTHNALPPGMRPKQFEDLQKKPSRTLVREGLWIQLIRQFTQAAERLEVTTDRL